MPTDLIRTKDFRGPGYSFQTKESAEPINPPKMAITSTWNHVELIVIKSNIWIGHLIGGTNSKEAYDCTPFEAGFPISIA